MNRWTQILNGVPGVYAPTKREIMGVAKVSREVTKKCHHCGSAFSVSRKEQRFCSKSCMGDEKFQANWIGVMNGDRSDAMKEVARIILDKNIKYRKLMEYTSSAEGYISKVLNGKVREIIFLRRFLYGVPMTAKQREILSAKIKLIESTY